MVCELVGFSKFTSKNGVDLIALHVVYDDDRVVGRAVDQLVTRESLVPPCRPGDQLNISFNRRGFVDSVDIG